MSRRAAAEARSAALTSIERPVSARLGDTERIEGYLARYDSGIVTLGKACRRRLREQVVRGFELVYDNYNALVFGYSPTPRTSDAVLSIALYPKWVTLFFLKGAALPDPSQLLSGSGKTVRGLRLASADDLAAAEVHALIQVAMAQAPASFDAAPRLATVIRSESAKQRPRRPV